VVLVIIVESRYVLASQLEESNEFFLSQFEESNDVQTVADGSGIAGVTSRQIDSNGIPYVIYLVCKVRLPHRLCIQFYTYIICLLEGRSMKVSEFLDLVLACSFYFPVAYLP